jgi:hypothetical protein
LEAKKESPRCVFHTNFAAVNRKAIVSTFAFKFRLWIVSVQFDFIFCSLRRRKVDKLTGYEIRFDLENNRILILKMPNDDDERAIAITISAANSAELEQLKSSFE